METTDISFIHSFIHSLSLLSFPTINCCIVFFCLPLYLKLTTVSLCPQHHKTQPIHQCLLLEPLCYRHQSRQHPTFSIFVLNSPSLARTDSYSYWAALSSKWTPTHWRKGLFQKEEIKSKTPFSFRDWLRAWFAVGRQQPQLSKHPSFVYVRPCCMQLHVSPTWTPNG